MTDKKNNQIRQERSNQTPQQDNRIQNGKEDAGRQESPGNRLKDGTNDFQNGDQEPTSERSSGIDDQSQNA